MAGAAYGAGLGFEYQSTKASARGNAFVASSGSSALIHYNPGGLISLDSSLAELNLFGIHGDLTWTDSSSDYSPDDELLISGSAYFALPWSSGDRNYAFGVGITTPYGQSSSWDADVPFRNNGYEATMRYYQLHVTAAAEISPGLGVGGSLIIANSRLISSGGVALPTDRLRFDGEDTSLAFQLGMHHRVNDWWSWGLNYRSGVKLKHKGEYTYESGNPFVPGSVTKGDFSFDLPEHVVLGCEIRPSEEWSVGLQVQWTGWSSIDKFEANIGGAKQQQVASWNDSLIYSVGATYQCSDNTELHCGYMYVEPLIDDVYSQVLVADFKQHFISTGVTHHVGNWSLDAAFVYVISEDEEVKGSLYGADGNYSSTGWFLNMGVGYKF